VTLKRKDRSPRAVPGHSVLRLNYGNDFLHGIFRVTSLVVNVAFALSTLALCLKSLVTRDLASGLFDGAFCLVGEAFNVFLIHFISFMFSVGETREQGAPFRANWSQLKRKSSPNAAFAITRIVPVRDVFCGTFGAGKNYNDRPLNVLSFEGADHER
jgi:hypothetical protein